MTATKRARKQPVTDATPSATPSPTQLKRAAHGSSPTPYFPNAAVPILLASAILALGGGMLRLPDAMSKACSSTSRGAIPDNATPTQEWKHVASEVAQLSVDVVARELHFLLFSCDPRYLSTRIPP